MNCPKCHDVTLKQVKANDQSIYLDACSQCKGLWFDNGELHGTIGMVTNEENVPKHAFKMKGTVCPKCNVNLFEYCYPGTTVLVDGCKQCQGVWLDNGEWNVIKNAVKSKNQITYPKCRTQQISATSCKKCGIVFEKYKKQKGDRVELERHIDEMFKGAISYNIHQELQWLEILTPFERKNRYKVSICQAKKYYHGEIHEHSRSIFNFVGRQLLGGLRPAELIFKDLDERLILKMTKHFRLYFHQIDLHKNNNVRLGSVKRMFHILRTNYDIENRVGKTILKIRGPFIFLPFVDQKFTILKNGNEVGKIVKKWKGILKENFTDSDSFNVRINPTLPVQEKILLFGSVFLIDFVSFENNQK